MNKKTDLAAEPIDALESFEDSFRAMGLLPGGGAGHHLNILRVLGLPALDRAGSLDSVHHSDDYAHFRSSHMNRGAMGSEELEETSEDMQHMLTEMEGPDDPNAPEEPAESTAHGNLHHLASWTHVSDIPGEPGEPVDLRLPEHRPLPSNIAVKHGRKSDHDIDNEQMRLIVREQVQARIVAHEPPSYWHLLYGPIMCFIILVAWNYRPKRERKPNFSQIASGVSSFDAKPHFGGKVVQVCTSVSSAVANMLHRALWADIRSVFVPGVGGAEELLSCLRNGQGHADKDELEDGDFL